MWLQLVSSLDDVEAAFIRFFSRIGRFAFCIPSPGYEYFVNDASCRNSRVQMLTEHLHRLINSESSEAAWALHRKLMEDFGFDRLIYRVVRSFSHSAEDDGDDVVTLSSHPESYFNGYMANEFYRYAPTVRWTREHAGACSWRWVEEEDAAGRLSDVERKAHAFNQKMGVTAGYTISFLNLSVRASGGIALTARHGLSQDDVDRIWNSDGDYILLVNKILHLKLLQLPVAGSLSPLTLRQREVLEWAAEGKTAQDIAMIMDLTRPTIEKHLRLARQNLKVDNTAQAVMKAMNTNQIFCTMPSALTFT